MFNQMPVLILFASNHDLVQVLDLSFCVNLRNKVHGCFFNEWWSSDLFCHRSSHAAAIN